MQEFKYQILWQSRDKGMEKKEVKEGEVNKMGYIKMKF